MPLVRCHRDCIGSYVESRISGRRSSLSTDHTWPVKDLLLIGTGQGLAHRCISTCPYVAPHTTKIHTLITLGIRHRNKPLVLKARQRLPRGFDSHRPLHLLLSGVSLRCPRMRPRSSSSSQCFDAGTAVPLITDLMVQRIDGNQPSHLGAMLILGAQGGVLILDLDYFFHLLPAGLLISIFILLPHSLLRSDRDCRWPGLDPEPPFASDCIAETNAAREGSRPR
jgi:hypothetical protein